MSDISKKIYSLDEDGYTMLRFCEKKKDGSNSFINPSSPKSIAIAQGKNTMAYASRGGIALAGCTMTDREFLDIMDGRLSKKDKKELPDGLYYFDNLIIDPYLIRQIEKFLKSDEFENQLFPVGKSENSRKVVHYGYSYDYKKGTNTDNVPEMPDVIRYLRDKIACILIDDQYIDPEDMNQCIINRYLPGQGIAPHIDSDEFGDYIACFTFCGGRELEFAREVKSESSESSDSSDIYKVYTKPGSLYVMSKDARYKYKHSMRGRKSDMVDGVKIPREECFSITFRMMK